METKTFKPKWPVMVALAGPALIAFGAFTLWSFFRTPPEDRNYLLLLGILLMLALGVYGPLVTVQKIDFAYDRLIVYRRMGRREIEYSSITDVSAYGVRAVRGGLYMRELANASEFAEIVQGLVSSGRINPYQLDGKLRTEEARMPTIVIGGLVVGVPLWFGLSAVGAFGGLEPEWAKHTLEACVFLGMAVVAAYFWLRDRLTLG